MDDYVRAGMGELKMAASCGDETRNGPLLGWPSSSRFGAMGEREGAASG